MDAQIVPRRLPQASRQRAQQAIVRINTTDRYRSRLEPAHHEALQKFNPIITEILAAPNVDKAIAILKPYATKMTEAKIKAYAITCALNQRRIKKTAILKVTETSQILLGKETFEHTLVFWKSLVDSKKFDFETIKTALFVEFKTFAMNSRLCLTYNNLVKKLGIEKLTSEDILALEEIAEVASPEHGD